MSAAEFFEAQTYLAEEPLDPGLLAALAEMLAALANGALQRKDKAVWRAADFLPERWRPAPPPGVPAANAEPSPIDFLAGLKAGAVAPVRRKR